MLILWQPQVVAEDHTDNAVTEVSVGIELFRWQEFGDDGTRLLTEQGPRTRLNLSRNNDARMTSGVIYSASGSLYGGDVEYDGQTQSALINKDGLFSAANVDYSGISGELSLGYRFSNLFWNRSLDLLAGFGADSWTRDIEAGVSSQGETVGGFVENYKIAFTRLSLGVENRAEIWRSLLRAGVKYPVFIKETIDLPALELKPGKKASLFFSYRFQLVNNGRLDRGTFVYFVYDGYRFFKSPEVSGFYQPRSHMDVVSISIGRAF